jgi:hypothetical protein
MHPPDLGRASASFRTGKWFAAFKTAAALNDTVSFTHNPAIFEVVGDGRLLWRSLPVRAPRQVQECSLDVTGVENLELRVEAQGSHFGLHAVWLEPRLLPAPPAQDGPGKH